MFATIPAQIFEIFFFVDQIWIWWQLNSTVDRMGFWYRGRMKERRTCIHTHIETSPGLPKGVRLARLTAAATNPKAKSLSVLLLVARGGTGDWGLGTS